MEDASRRLISVSARRKGKVTSGGPVVHASMISGRRRRRERGSKVRALDLEPALRCEIGFVPALADKLYSGQRQLALAD